MADRKNTNGSSNEEPTIRTLEERVALMRQMGLSGGMFDELAGVDSKARQGGAGRVTIEGPVSLVLAGDGHKIHITIVQHEPTKATPSRGGDA
jgi:hypothetical protein